MAELSQKMTDHHLPGVAPGKALASWRGESTWDV
jgi:hypothetical protein